MTKPASTNGAVSSILITIQRAWLPLFVVLSLAFLASYFFRAASQLHQPLKFSLPWLLATTTFSVAYWAMASAIWRQVVSLTSSARLSHLQSLGQLVMVTLGKYMPGKVWGMVARGAQLTKQGATSGDAAFATYYEQYMLLHASLILSCLLFFFLFPVAGPVAGFAAAFVVAVLGVRLRETGTKAFLYILKRFGRGSQITQKRVTTEAYSLLLAKFIFLWLLNSGVFVSLFLTFFQADITTSLLLSLVIANIVGVTLGFFALFAPGGIGVREAIISAVLLSVLPLADGLLLSVLYRLWLVLSELIAGFIVVLGRARPHDRPV